MHVGEISVHITQLSGKTKDAAVAASIIQPASCEVEMFNHFSCTEGYWWLIAQTANFKIIYENIKIKANP